MAVLAFWDVGDFVGAITRCSVVSSSSVVSAGKVYVPDFPAADDTCADGSVCTLLGIAPMHSLAEKGDCSDVLCVGEVACVSHWIGPPCDA